MGCRCSKQTPITVTEGTHGAAAHTLANGLNKTTGTCKTKRTSSGHQPLQTDGLSPPLGTWPWQPVPPTLSGHTTPYQAEKLVTLFWVEVETGKCQQHIAEVRQRDVWDSEQVLAEQARLRDVVRGHKTHPSPQTKGIHARSWRTLLPVEASTAAIRDHRCPPPSCPPVQRPQTRGS